MSKRIEIAHRRLLPLTVAAYLLAAAATQLAGDGTAPGQPAGRAGLQVAGVHIGLGFHGGPYWGHHYRPYYWGGYRPFYHPRAYHHGYYGVPRYASSYFGGLDLNVKPKKTTQVYIDGNYVGLTGNFDGWPEYLWLEASRRPGSGGTNIYELILYNPGYKTVVRQVEIQPGVVIKIRENMVPGESIPPEELTRAKPREREEAPRYESRPPSERAEPAPRPRERTEPLPRPRERAEPLPRRAPEATRPDAARPDAARPDAARPEALDVRREPARLLLAVAPADASVYLDGHFLGIAGEIGERRSGILIDPGEHRLEIVRPGYAGREIRFDAEAGGEVELEVELESGASA